jgi:hypothetical protein
MTCLFIRHVGQLLVQRPCTVYCVSVTRRVRRKDPHSQTYFIYWRLSISAEELNPETHKLDEL